MNKRTKQSLKSIQKRLKSILKNNDNYSFPRPEIEDAIDDIQRAIEANYD